MKFHAIDLNSQLLVQWFFLALVTNILPLLQWRTFLIMLLPETLSILSKNPILSHYTPCFIKTTPYLIAHNFGKCWPIFKFFSPRTQQRSCNELIIKGPTTPKGVDTTFTTLWNKNVRKLPTIWNKCLV